MNVPPNPVVGQEVAIVNPRYDSTLFGFVVAKVTPTGQVLVSRTTDNYTKRFDKFHKEMDKYNSSSYTAVYLDFDVEKLKEKCV
jgi:hypothetical protein